MASTRIVTRMLGARCSQTPDLGRPALPIRWILFLILFGGCAGTINAQVLAEYPAGFQNDPTPTPVLTFGQVLGGFDFQQSMLNEVAAAVEFPVGSQWSITGIRFLASQVCSLPFVALRVYESDAASRLPDTMIYEGLACAQDDGIVTYGSTSYRIQNVQPCNAPGGNLLLENAGPDNKRLWFSVWGPTSCLTQSIWLVCKAQLALDPPTPFRCGVSTECPTTNPPTIVKVWNDYSGLNLPLPNCPLMFQLTGAPVHIFADSFES